MKSLIAACVLGSVSIAAPACALAQQKTKVTIYTALENDLLAPFKASIEGGS